MEAVTGPTPSITLLNTHFDGSGSSLVINRRSPPSVQVVTPETVLGLTYPAYTTSVL